MLQPVHDPQLSGASVLVTGGTGSFGRRFIRRLLAMPNGPARVVVLSRDELKQWEMRQDPALDDDKRMRWFLGDVRDLDRLRRAFDGVDVVVHAAALKQVPAAEYNPFEFVKTNVIGAQNVIDAALDCGVSRVVALSTDKAAAPINLYGATKLCSDKLFVAANAYKGRRNIRLSVVRYGNVFGSRGSVVPFFLARRKTGVLPITDARMTRFSLSLDEGVSFVFNALGSQLGGELFVPRLPSYRILDLAAAVAPDCRLETVGIRPGEKIHEEMITAGDSHRTAAFGSHYVILPPMPTWDEDGWLARNGGSWAAPDFAYDSGTNDAWLDIPTLSAQVERYLAGEGGAP